MRPVHHIKALAACAKTEDLGSLLMVRDEEPRSARSFRAVQTPNSTTCDSRPPGKSDFERIDEEFPFLKSNSAAPLAARLARGLAEAVRAIRRDPVAFLGAIPESGPIPLAEKGKRRAGLTVAIVVYAVALLGIYASYSIFHRTTPRAAAVSRLEITSLAPPPLPVKAPPVFKQTGGAINKSQLQAPLRPAEQPKAESTEARPVARPLDQAQSTTEPKPQISTAASGPSSLASGTAPTGPFGDGGHGAGTADGAGTSWGAGEKVALSAAVNYNDVFPVGAVTTRPQIVGRPVPGYTEEARRAQVEGAVRVSVVLNPNGTVSAITVVRRLGYGLDEKAIEAARQLRFVPAQKDGHTVSVRVFLEFKFSLL